MEKSFEVDFLGQKITLKADGDAENLREVLDLVMERLKECKTRSKSPAAHQVALLALLDIAEDYLKAKKAVTHYQETIQNETKRLIELVESELS